MFVHKKAVSHLLSRDDDFRGHGWRLARARVLLLVQYVSHYTWRGLFTRLKTVVAHAFAQSEPHFSPKLKDENRFELCFELCFLLRDADVHH